jgi:UDP-glucose 4-epimerase
MGRRIVVTGVAGYWGCALARELERDPSVEAVIGIDIREPPVHLERTELIEADIRSPVMARLLPSTKADTVVHCGILWYPEPGKPARTVHDINVIGTLQLLAACERVETLERVVVRGSAAIYGCEPASPSFFTEEMARRMPLRTRFQRDIGELESYFHNFARRHQHLVCCMLRYQPEIGADLPMPLVRYLTLPVVPTQLGFDPRLQLIHEQDATGALVAATHEPIRGAVNVAPTGSISLSRLLRLAGRPALPIPHQMYAPALRRLASELGTGQAYSDAIRLLRWGRGVDNTRLRKELGYQPQFDAVGAVKDFADRTRGRSVVGIPGIGDLLGRVVPQGASS